MKVSLCALGLFTLIPFGVTNPVSQVINSSFNTPPFTQKRSLSNGVALRIQPLGDSITWGYLSSDGNGYRQDLLNMLSGNPVQYVGSQRSGTMADNFNEGHPGAVISQIAGYAPLSLPDRPNIILLMAGTNDCNIPEDPADAPARLGSLIDECIAACPDAVIIVAQLTPIANAASQANVETFNAAVPGVVASRASQGAHILTVDMSDFVTVDELDDGLHPTDAGYANMATAWFGALEQAASNGWISPPVSAGNTGKGQGTCLSGLYWDPSHGSIASGVGSGDASFTSVWFGVQAVPVIDVGSGSSFQSSGFRLGRMFPNTASSYMQVDSTSGAVNLFANLQTAPDGLIELITAWGQIASGIGDGPGVTFADIDGDGVDDYIWISEDGDVTAYRNGGQGSGGPFSETWIWIPMGVIASNLGGGVRGTIIFGDIDGDGRADYHVVNNATGALTSFLNMGPGTNPTWQPLGQIASGLGGGGEVMLADLNGDGRADYIWSNPATGVVTAYINTRGLASGLAPVWIPANIDLTFLGANFSQIAFADFNNDGKADYVTQRGTGVQVTSSQCSGDAYVTGDGTRFADLNGDGLDDYIWMDINGEITLYLNGGWDSSGGQIWLPQGVIATGVGSPRSEIHLADLDGDGLADYLVVDPTSGAVTFWKNGGSGANEANGWLWLPQGEIASGIGAGAGVRFADIDGDGRDDYLWLDGNGAVTAYINGGPSASQPGGWLWLPQGVIATGVGAAREDVQFADINGDGKADYLWVGRLDGTVNLWYNGGPGSDQWIWYPAGEVATGTGSNGLSVMFADTTGDGRDDYLVVTPSTGALSVWLNGCSGGFSGGSAPTVEWTAWGDSYASGVGSGAYIDGRRCLRYANAYPIFLRDDPDRLFTGFDVKMNYVACSGAKAEEVTDYQLYNTDQSSGQPNWQYYPRPSSGKPSVGTLSVGGDDIDFPGILNNCIIEGFPFPLSSGFTSRTCDEQRALTWSMISENGDHDEPNLELIAKIDSTIKSIVNYAHSQIGGNIFYLYVTGYGQFFNDQDPGCNTVTFARLANPKNDGKSHVLMTTDLRQDFNLMTLTLNAAIKQAVSQNDGSSVNVIVRYIDIDGLMGTGHRFCEPGIQEPDQDNPNLWFFHYPYGTDDTNDPTIQYLNSVEQANVNTLTWDQNSTLWVDYLNEFWSQVDETQLNQTVAGSGDVNAQLDIWPDIIGFRAKVFHPQVAYHEAIYDAIARQHISDLGGGAI